MVGKSLNNQLSTPEEHYQLLVDSIKDHAIFMLDSEGFIVTWNKGASRIKLYSEEEIIGKHFSIFYPEQLRKTGYPEWVLQKALEEGGYKEKGWRLRKGGIRFWSSITINPIYQEGKCIGYSKVTRDLSHNKKSAQKLQQSEQRYHLLIDAVKDYAIFMLDPAGIISSWNTGAKRLKGYHETEIIGQHFSVFYMEKDIRSGFPDYGLVKARQEGKFEDEGWRVRKDGSRFWAHVFITPIFQEEALIGFAKVTRDLSERSKAQEQLQKRNTELQRINSDLDSFVYAASHDLKAPILNVEGLLSVLYDSCLSEHIESDDKVKTIYNMLQVSIDRFKNTIQDLTEISYLQREEVIAKESVSLSSILEEVKLFMRDLITVKNAEIITDFEVEYLKISRRNIRSIFYNLLSNSLKYSSPDRPPVIKIHASLAEKNYLVLRFADNGLGIKKGQKDKIFTMFKRLHQHVEGSGIGLFLVKRIVEDAEGKIEVDSEEGKGTTFTIFLSARDI